MAAGLAVLTLDGDLHYHVIGKVHGVIRTLVPGYPLALIIHGVEAVPLVGELDGEFLGIEDRFLAGQFNQRGETLGLFLELVALIEVDGEYGKGHHDADNHHHHQQFDEREPPRPQRGDTGVRRAAIY